MYMQIARTFVAICNAKAPTQFTKLLTS